MAKPVAGWGRKLPTAGTLALGILVGLIFATIFRSSPPSGTTWTGGHSNGLRSSAIGGGSRLSRMVELPTLDQRYRILEIIGSLSAHHTKECTRTPQKPYVEQVHQRYKPLFGFKPHRHGSWFFGSGGSSAPALEDARQQIRRDLGGSNHKYFIAINLYNSFDVIPDLFATLFRVSAVLGYQNVYVSIYENGSSDQTKALLKIFDALARTVGMRIIIRTSMRTRGQFNHRIEYLAEVRNAAMVPLRELRDTEGELFDSIIFMNDILPCVDDVLELIWQSRRQNAGITCAADYMFHDDIVRIPFFRPDVD
jgi:alpha-1,3-mannosyltransferase